MFEHKNPACLPTILRRLYLIQDAIARRNWEEVHNILLDSCTLVQDEIDWCYGTDSVLSQIKEFLVQLANTVEVVQYSIRHNQQTQADELVQILKNTVAEVVQTTSSSGRHNTPDRYLDALERRERFNL